MRRTDTALGLLVIVLFALNLFVPNRATAQTTNGTISGIVFDPSGRAIPGAEILIVNDATRVTYSAKTNSEGIYAIPNLPPGPYRMQVSKSSFKSLIKPDIILHVEDALAINFTLPVGATSEVVTVEGGAPLINTESATVSTVVDRQFAENLPMNGRSFQTLIDLTPGVVIIPPNGADTGQFSVNGQRASSNYWMVDGVSANIGVGTGSIGNGLGGTVGSFSALGGTNSLVSVDAMQEFRIQTSTYAPEFGREPGAQIAIVTRSGTDDFHGTAFDYLRNDVLDASNWFNGYTNVPSLPKARDRQNDFGGTFGGRLLKDKTFFFFSYEGLRLRLPQTALTSVPDQAARAQALPALQPYFAAYPLPNGLDQPAQGEAQFDTTYSNPATLDAYSLRLDHNLSDRWAFFGRYDYSPSQSGVRGGGGYEALSQLADSRITTQTATAGAIWKAQTVANDLRFNYSQVAAKSWNALDNFGGATPLAAPPYPAPFDNQNANFEFGIYALGQGGYVAVGDSVETRQRQVNLVDSFSWQKGSHSLKFGADFRELFPFYDPASYSQAVFFSDVSSAGMGTSVSGSLTSRKDVTVLFENLGLYAQDTWRLRPSLTLSYGLRWDVDFSPSTTGGAEIPALAGYSLTDLSQLELAPAGAPPFRTQFGGFAPRVGLAYQLPSRQNWQTVVRGGFGVFYDLVSAETGTAIGQQFPPFGANEFLSGGTFPFAASQASPLPIPAGGSLSEFYGFNPRLKQPYTLQWNLALEQSLGKDQSLSASYVGAKGERLLQTTSFNFSNPPASNPNLHNDSFIDNTANSEYDALQLQFHRRLSAGLQVLAAYTWSHSIDDGSASSYAGAGNRGAPGTNQNWGDSDFDIRNAATIGLTYEVPSPPRSELARWLFGHWSTENFVMTRSAPPLNVDDIHFSQLDGSVAAAIRPDVVAGQPFYLFGGQYPGGKALNPLAFTNPPLDPTTHLPLRQGTLGRNALRAFAATQWDFAVHRDFPLHDLLKMQFRAEMFNLLNHPSFGPPNAYFGEGGFGISTQTLNESLSPGIAATGSGGFNPLYQIGGPRSIQLALKLFF